MAKTPKPKNTVKPPQYKQRQAKSGKMTLYEKRSGSSWKKAR